MHHGVRDPPAVQEAGDVLLGRRHVVFLEVERHVRTGAVVRHPGVAFAPVADGVSPPEEEAALPRLVRADVPVGPERAALPEPDASVPVGRVVVVRTGSQAVESGKSLNQFESELGDVYFFRTQRRFLVGFRYIAQKEDDVLIMQNGERVKISRRRLPAFHQALIRYMKMEKQP